MINQSKLDPENMFGSIYDFADHIEQAIEIGNKIELKNDYSSIDNVVVAGMGGSAIGGDVVLALMRGELRVPVVVTRNYSLPNWVNDHSLVICSSYSGNTEETLSMYNEARRKGAQIYGISAGGELIVLLTNAGYDLIRIPVGFQPRAALAFSFIPMLFLLKELEIISDRFKASLLSTIALLKSKRGLYSIPDEENPTYSLAQKIYNTIPVIYGESDSTSIVAGRWKGQFCENAKMLAYHNSLPEMNHNEIEGWENNDENFNHFTVIWLVDESDHQRVIARQKITSSIFQEIGLRQENISVVGNNRFERLIHLIHYGDWVSYWCAIAHSADPTSVNKIMRLKKAIKSIKRLLHDI